MQMKLAAGAVLGVMLAGCGLGGPRFPTFGETAYRLAGTTTSENGASVETVIFRDGPNMRVETTLPGRGAAVIVFNEATQAAYVLQPAGTPIAGGAAAPAGVAIRVADAQAPRPLEAAWASLGPEGAVSLGPCAVAGENGHRWQPKEDAQGVSRDACITQDGIVLEVREGEAVLFQAASLTRGAQDPSLFGVPPGYTLIDPRAVMEGIGATLDQLDSVTGARAQPAPSAAPAPAEAPADQ